MKSGLPSLALANTALSTPEYTDQDSTFSCEKKKTTGSFITTSGTRCQPKHVDARGSVKKFDKMRDGTTLCENETNDCKKTGMNLSNGDFYRNKFAPSLNIRRQWGKWIPLGFWVGGFSEVFRIVEIKELLKKQHVGYCVTLVFLNTLVTTVCVNSEVPHGNGYLSSPWCNGRITATSSTWSAPRE